MSSLNPSTINCENSEEFRFVSLHHRHLMLPRPCYLSPLYSVEFVLSSNSVLLQITFSLSPELAEITLFHPILLSLLGRTQSAGQLVTAWKSYLCFSQFLRFLACVELVACRSSLVQHEQNSEWKQGNGLFPPLSEPSFLNGSSIILVLLSYCLHPLPIPHSSELHQLVSHCQNTQGHKAGIIFSLSPVC